MNSLRIRRAERGLSAAWLAASLVVAVAAAAIVLAFFAWGPLSGTSNAWTAVFLTDNEIFFGHLKTNTNDRVELTNVFYLQRQTGSGTGTNANFAIAGLVGNQIQCPKDDLTINHSGVLYMETLQNSSYVVSLLNYAVKTPESCFTPPVSSAAPGTSAPTP